MKKNNKTGKVARQTTLEKILEMKGAEDVLQKHGVPCLSCPLANLEMQELKIGNVCSIYGIDEKKLIEDLNSIK
ncbi:MAG: hypothetical protein HYT36_03885 [Candidatus Staskawiczbacteria bacterium]|nr:hypothetical protein [Candidatus Staskawiczbacteria bacterium]